MTAQDRIGLQRVAIGSPLRIQNERLRVKAVRNNFGAR